MLYNHSYFDMFSFHLISVGQGRRSTDILKSLKLKERKSICEGVDIGTKLIESKDYDLLNDLILKGWEKKKGLSPLILNNDILNVEKKYCSFL